MLHDNSLSEHILHSVRPWQIYGSDFMTLLVPTPFEQTNSADDSKDHNPECRVSDAYCTLTLCFGVSSFYDS